MESIIKRLLESKEDDMLDTSLFDMTKGSDEFYDLLEILDNRVKGALLKFGMGDVDLDDSGLTGGSEPTPTRTITYRTQIYRFKDSKMLPLAKKEQSSIVSALTKTVNLPPSDEEYDYSVGIDIAGTELSIALRRDESL